MNRSTLVFGALACAALALLAAARWGTGCWGPIGWGAARWSSQISAESMVEPANVPGPRCELESREIDAAILARYRIVDVVDDSGRAVADVSIREAHLDEAGRWLGGRGCTMRSDATGRAFFPRDPAPDGSVARIVYVVDEPDRWLYRQWRHSVDVDTVELCLVRGSSLSGRVLFSEGAWPESEAGLRVRFVLDDYVGETYAPIVAGKFRFANNVGGRIVGAALDLPHAGGIESRFEAFDIAPGERLTRDFSFDLGPTLGLNAASTSATAADGEVRELDSVEVSDVNASRAVAPDSARQP